jgi:hypothetical protein
MELRSKSYCIHLLFGENYFEQGWSCFKLGTEERDRNDEDLPSLISVYGDSSVYEFFYHSERKGEITNKFARINGINRW